MAAGTSVGLATGALVAGAVVAAGALVGLAAGTAVGGGTRVGLGAQLTATDTIKIAKITDAIHWFCFVKNIL